MRHTEILGAQLRRYFEAHGRRRAHLLLRAEARVAAAHHRRRRERRARERRLIAPRDRDAPRERRLSVVISGARRVQRGARPRRAVQTAAAAAAEQSGRDAHSVRVEQREVRRVDRFARNRTPAQLTRQVHVHVLCRLERQLHRRTAQSNRVYLRSVRI